MRSLTCAITPDLVTSQQVLSRVDILSQNFNNLNTQVTGHGVVAIIYFYAEEMSKAITTTATTAQLTGRYTIPCNFHPLTFLVILNGNCMFVNIWWFEPREKDLWIWIWNSTNPVWPSEQLAKCWVWWCMSMISALWRWRQENQEFPGVHETKSHNKPCGARKHPTCEALKTWVRFGSEWCLHSTGV